MSEKICQRCRRVCFSEEEYRNHPCFDMGDRLDAEIAMAISAQIDADRIVWDSLRPAREKP